MTAQLVRVLGVCLTAIMFLFLLRIAHIVSQSIPRLDASGRHGARANGVQRLGIPCIVVRAPETERGRRHDLTNDLTIGRGADCDVTIDDGYSSEVHARLYERNGLHIVEDLGSTNGTYVNRERVQSATVIHPGDHIQVGATVFEMTS